MKAVLEGLLFLVGEDGLDLNQIYELLNIDSLEANNLISELSKDYTSPDRGIKIEFLGNKYKLTTKVEHKEYYEKLVVEENNKELTQSCLETLAIIAYNEPITRVEVDEIRGVSSMNAIKKLLLRDLIKNLGRSDKPGKPYMYGTTNKFLDYFGLKDKSELPKIEVVENSNDEIDLFKSKYKED